MQVQITDAGVALLQSNEGPVVLTLAKFGSGVNYIPDPAATNIQGTLEFQAAPSIPVAVSANLVRYSVYVDVSVPTFQFGELGLFTEAGTLFAIAVNSTTITKQQATSEVWGNSLRLDVYLSSVGQNYDMWMDYAESNNQFHMAVLGSPDNLPQPQQAIPNAYVVTGASEFQSAFLAYTDRNGLWNFDAYAYATQASGTVLDSDSKSVVIDASQFTDAMNPFYFGRVLLQFTSGPLYGTCRYVKTAILSTDKYTLGFQTPMMKLPNVGDTFVVFTRQNDTTEVILPIATHTQLGGVIVGQSLTVQSDGTLDVDYTKVPYPVKSVAGKTGDVLLTYQDIGGLAAVAHTGDYNDLINKPAAYSLPVATQSVLGGVKAPANGNLTINASGVIDLGFTAVKSVNGKTDVVELVATDIPGFAAVALSGDYNDLINKPTIPAPYVLPTASATVLGGIKVGTGLAIDGSGVLSATGGGGTVFSVGLTLPAEFNVANSPVTNSGTLAGTWANQNPGYVFASPAIGGGAVAGTPSFKQLSLGASVTNAWNAADKSTRFTLTNGGLQVNLASAPASFSMVRGTQSHNSGRWVFEWTCPAHIAPVQGGGIATTQDGVDSGLVPGQDDTSGSMLRADGFVTAGHTTVACAITQTPAGAVIMVAVDIDAGLIWYRKNNGNWNANASANPATGVGGIAITAGLTYYPMFMFAFNSTVGDSSLLNVGATTFTNSVPAGFQSWNALDTRNVVPIDSNIQAPATNDVIYFANGKWTNGPVSSIVSSYTLPVATTTVLGGVKQGSGVTIAGDGTLSVAGGPQVAADIVSYTFFGGL